MDNQLDQQLDNRMAALSANNSKMERPLRFTHPDYYRQLLDQMEEYHLHPFDMQATAIVEDQDITIIVRYGDLPGKVNSKSFLLQEAAQSNEGMNEFFGEVAKDCKKILISDYYKFMKG